MEYACISFSCNWYCLTHSMSVLDQSRMSSCVTNFPSFTLNLDSSIMETLTTFPSMLRRSVFRSTADKIEKTTSHGKSVKRSSTLTQRQAKLDHNRPLVATAGSQREAQTALLLSVIRATPNDVFYTIAKDFLVEACNKAVAFFKPLVSEGKHDAPSPGRDNDDDRSGCTICPHCQSGNTSVLQSAEFLILKSFIKLVVKLYLTLILEVTTLALKLLG